MSAEEPGVPGGPLAWMAQNSVAANLLMFVMLAAGFAGLLRTKQEVFPAFTLDIVTVAVPYPGASPSEVEQGIVLAVEEEVRSVDGIKRITSVASEGAASIGIELDIDANGDRVLADVKSAVDRITSFPEDAEEPTVSLMSQRRRVVSLILAGDQDPKQLFDLAERTRERLLDHPDISYVDIEGVRELEVSIDVPRERLEAYGLSLEQIAARVRTASLELPGGSLKTDGGEVLVRLADRRTEGHQYEDIVVRGTLGGSDVRLGDVADIVDGFADSDQFTYFNGKPAARIVAYRTGDETPTRVAAVVHALANDLRAELPPDMTVAIWDDDSKMLADRVDLLMRNARMGLVLVFVVLALLLDLRLALWVGLGIPVSIMGAFALMPAADVSINMVSLFAFIVTLGMVVDDAIVVGENVYEKEQEGTPRLQAAIEGVREMAVPVTFSILTTMVAFSPLLAVPGFMGKIFRIMPIVVILVLLMSWVESFWVLPSHLAHDYSLLWRLTPRPVRWVVHGIDAVRRPVTRGLDAFNLHLYAPLLRVAAAQRYAVAAAALGLFVITMGAVGGGIVKFSFFPKLEGDVVTASARLPYGTPVEQTAEVQRALEAAAMSTLAELQVPENPELFRGMYSTVGQGPRQGGPGNASAESGSHLVTVQVQLSPSGEREVSALDFAGRWAAATPPMAGVEALKFNSSSGPGAGAAVAVQLGHSDTAVLARASEEMLTELRAYPQLMNHENGYASGKSQLDFHLLPQASTFGLTGQEVARQLRSAFYGAEALREQRGRHEVKVMVRLPPGERDSERDLEQLRIVRGSGEAVHLSTVAELERSRAPTKITREDGRRVVDVTAELAPGVTSSREVIESLREDVFPAFRERYPALDIDLAGEQRDQGEVFRSLGTNTVLVMFVMFAMLAIPFRSYVQPAIVMAAIPMGFVGAVGGHLLMGYELSMISFFGIIALSGVVVNDSLVMIDAINQRRAAGDEAMDAVLWGGTRRLRPILLTSLTTFFGLAPMILETSFQARFLIPMAISLGFGVLFATVVTLLLVPALYLIVHDVQRLGSWLARTSAPMEAPGETDLQADYQ